MFYDHCVPEQLLQFYFVCSMRHGLVYAYARDGLMHIRWCQMQSHA